jgi:hypothetical protein
MGKAAGGGGIAEASRVGTRKCTGLGSVNPPTKKQCPLRYDGADGHRKGGKGGLQREGGGAGVQGVGEGGGALHLVGGEGRDDEVIGLRHVVGEEELVDVRL